MDLMSMSWGGALLGASLVLPVLHRRLKLSRSKHRSLAGHARISSWLAKQVPAYAFPEDTLFGVDGAPGEVVARRRAAFEQLARLYAERFPRGRALGEEAAEGLSDMQLTSRYRVPYPFAPYVRRQLAQSSFVEGTHGAYVRDVDGNELIDLAGSYGVNVLGYDFYKACLDEANAVGRALGPLLGAYHPCVLDVVKRLRAISGLDEVTFHMSGTEAVMQAVRLARYHTGRRKIVRFCGAYHGFWGDVQPGVGNPVPAYDTLTLADMSARSLDVIRTRRDIACVLVRPPTRACSTAGGARTSTVPPTRATSRSCARCARSAASR